MFTARKTIVFIAFLFLRNIREIKRTALSVAMYLLYGLTILTVFKRQYMLFGTRFLHRTSTKILTKDEILILVTSFDLHKKFT